MPPVTGSVLMGEQIVYSGPVEIVEAGEAWKASFPLPRPIEQGESDMQLNLTDGRTGRLVVARTEGAGSGAFTIYCQGAGPLKKF